MPIFIIAQCRIIIKKSINCLCRFYICQLFRTVFGISVDRDIPSTKSLNRTTKP